MDKKELLEYCKKKDIFVPPNASKQYLETAIVKAVEHRGEPEKDNCFGYWLKDHGPCMVCDLQEKCSYTALGMLADKYFKAVEKVENPRFRILEPLRKSNVKFLENHKRSSPGESAKGREEK